MKIKVIGCGGTGLNIAQLYKKIGVFNKEGQISLLALDTSEANIDENVTIEHLLVPGLNGSGSERGLNIEKYGQFCDNVLAQQEPAELYVLVYSGGGGTGSSMGPTLHRSLLKRDLPVISIVVGDKHSIKRGTNTVSTLININDFTTLGVPPIFAYFENNSQTPQSHIDKDIVSYIDLIYVMFGAKNKRIDNADIKHFFNFSKVTKAKPILSELKFLSENTVSEYGSTPVACISLFKDEDSIVSPFPSVLYDKTGIFNDQVRSDKFPVVHAVLDHGASFSRIKNMLDEQRQTNAKVNTNYQSDSLVEGGDIVKHDNGFVDLDI